jgi:hypothetical protein
MGRTTYLHTMQGGLQSCTYDVVRLESFRNHHDFSASELRTQPGDILAYGQKEGNVVAWWCIRQSDGARGQVPYATLREGGGPVGLGCRLLCQVDRYVDSCVDSFVDSLVGKVVSGQRVF